MPRIKQNKFTDRTTHDVNKPLKFNYSTARRILGGKTATVGKKKKTVTTTPQFTIGRDTSDLLHLLNSSDTEVEAYRAYATIFKEGWFGLYKPGIELIKSIKEGRHDFLQGNSMRCGFSFRILVTQNRTGGFGKDTLVLLCKPSITDKCSGDYELYAEFIALKIMLLVRFIYEHSGCCGGGGGGVKTRNTSAEDIENIVHSSDQCFVISGGGTFEIDRLIPVFILTVKPNYSWYNHFLRIWYCERKNVFIKRIIYDYGCNILIS